MPATMTPQPLLRAPTQERAGVPEEWQVDPIDRSADEAPEITAGPVPPDRHFCGFTHKDARHRGRPPTCALRENPVPSQCAIRDRRRGLERPQRHIRLQHGITPRILSGVLLMTQR